MSEHILTLAFSTCTVLTQNCTVLSESVITNSNLPIVLQANRKLLLHCNSMQFSNIICQVSLFLLLFLNSTLVCTLRMMTTMIKEEVIVGVSISVSMYLPLFQKHFNTKTLVLAYNFCDKL